VKCFGLTLIPLIIISTLTSSPQKQTGTKLKDFKAALENGPEAFPDLVALRNDVQKFAQQFPTVGYEM
jgi:hypothetical protein